MGLLFLDFLLGEIKLSTPCQAPDFLNSNVGQGNLQVLQPLHVGNHTWKGHQHPTGSSDFQSPLRHFYIFSEKFRPEEQGEGVVTFAEQEDCFAEQCTAGAN